MTDEQRLCVECGCPVHYGSRHHHCGMVATKYMARISELERELSTKDDTIVDSLMKRNELKRELAEARKDAGRYRWLRDEDNWGDDTGNRWAILGELTHGEFDNWIDAAMRQESE